MCGTRLGWHSTSGFLVSIGPTFQELTCRWGKKIYHTEQIHQRQELDCSVPRGLSPAEMSDGRCTRRDERPRGSLVPGLGGRAVFGCAEWLGSTAG